MSGQIDLLHDGAAELLQDINAYLHVEPPDPARALFEHFRPHFAKFRHLELSEALASAYRRLDRPEVRERVRRDAVECLARCANHPLGIARTLIVIDFVHALWPEYFKQSLWSRLLARYDASPQLRSWVGDLILRWSDWNVHVELSSRERSHVLKVVEPARFECALTYLVTTTAAQDSTTKNKELSSLHDLAVKRLHRDAKLFWDDEVDPESLESKVHDLCRGIRAPTVPRSTGEEADRSAIASRLEGTWGSVSASIGFGKRVDVVEALAEEIP